MRFIPKYKFFFTALHFLLLPGIGNAQFDPCGGGDDRGGFGCPLLSFFGLKPEGDSINIDRLHAVDPNEISGPLGYDTARWVSIKDNLGYTIFFENDPDFATAPAQVVEIRFPVDPKLDIFSLRLNDFGFGFFTYSPPPNSATYTERLDVIDSLGVYVDVTAGIDVVKKEAFWIFESIDPATGLAPEDARTGFLPVNDTTINIYNDTLPKRGEGFVSFTIRPNKNDVTGDSIQAQASIIFDINAPLETNVWNNLVDAVAPVSALNPLPETSETPSILLEWSGVDDTTAVGVSHYEIYVSENGGDFYLYQDNVDTTALVFIGVEGSTYAFFTRAVDNVGNKEALKGVGEYSVSIGSGLQLSPVVYLQGAYDPVSGLLRDALRTGSILPLGEPFTGLDYAHVGGGGENTLQSILDVDGNDAIVDWVFVELRDKSDQSLVLATRSALLQRDGDVVDVDGVSPLMFANLPEDTYYVTIKHRNHLGVMSATPVALSKTAALIDFTSDVNNSFGGTNGIAALEDGKLGLYSGDFNLNGQVQNTDYNDMIPTLGTAGYLPGDFDLNGQVQNTDLQLNLVPNIGKGQPFGQ